MDDAPYPGRSSLYSRLLSGADIRGLFTRPPHLAIADELRHGLPVIALSRACDRLRCGYDSDGGKLSVDEIAREEGFEDFTQFNEIFFAATGLYPADWQKRFGPRF